MRNIPTRLQIVLQKGPHSQDVFAATENTRLFQYRNLSRYLQLK
jgi:hypothetical protein